jgi:Flp pilus assembly protein TadG
MKCLGIRLMRRLLKNERGQTAVIVMLTAGTMMALSGATVEMGHIYYAYQRLVASTNAAALAGAQAMPSTTSAASYVTLYSSQSGQLNANPMLTNVVATPTFLCSSGVNTNFNVVCETSTGGTGGYNALSVTQTGQVKLWFGGLIGMRSMNLSATAEAAMRGGTNRPWNIAIIMDTTASMGSSDGGTQCSGTREACALQGLRILLGDLYPCALGQTCTTAGSLAVDSVSLFVFPAVTTGTGGVANDYTCTNGRMSNPAIVPYTIPNTTPAYTNGTAPASTLMLPSGDTYEISGWLNGQLGNNGFVNDYKTTDTAAGLNPGSNIVIAAGGKTGCAGLQTPGGEGTYYAQTIYAAQAMLAGQQAANTNSRSAIIILGDGDMNACASNAYTTGGACNSKGELSATEGTLNGTGTKTSNPNGYTNPTFPSAVGECGQAVLAAQYAANSGTSVYTIGYGAPKTGSCTTDKTYSASVTTNGGSWGAGKQACDALAAMASTQVNFYSDNGSGCQATAPSNQNLTQLTAIFRAVTNNLSEPRLVPAGT